jgi:hypothetical protein
MFKNFIGPDPVEEIAKPGIFRSEGETISSQGMVRVITRPNIFTVGLPHGVGPRGGAYLKSKCRRWKEEKDKKPRNPNHQTSIYVTILSMSKI